MNSISEKNIFTAIIIVAITLIPWLGFYDFYTRGEAREALIVQSMLSSGDWILPRGYNDAVPSKPPLFHWVAAASSLPFGAANEFSCRIPSGLFALFALTFFILSIRSTLSVQGQTLFILLLTFSFEWLRASVSARVDMVHAASLACGLLAAFFALEQGRWRWWIFTVILLALATLGKGPVAIAIPCLALCVWILIRPSDKKFFKFSKLAAALALVFVLSLTWYGAAYLRAPSEFFNRFWYENVARFTSTMEDTPHSHSFLYLIAMLFLGTLPWSPLILWLIYKKSPHSKAKLIEEWKKTPPLIQFCIIATLNIVLFYCVPSSKRGVYLLAAYPFLALAVAFSFEKVVVKPYLLRRIFFSLMALVILAQAVAIPFFVAPQTTERDLAARLKTAAIEGNTVYSFGYEFYGASFYSGKRILRLESKLNSEGVLPYHTININDLVMTIESSSDDLRRLLDIQNLTLVLVGEVALGKKKVQIFSVV